MISILMSSTTRLVSLMGSSRGSERKRGRIKTTVLSKRATSSKVWWSHKSGVTNLGFTSDDENECSSPESPGDSGFDDAFSPITSPISKDSYGNTHNATFNWQKSQNHTEATAATSLLDFNPSNKENRCVALKSRYGSTDDRLHFKFSRNHSDKRLLDGVSVATPFTMTSQRNEVSFQQVKKACGVSLIDPVACSDHQTRTRNPQFVPQNSQRYRTLGSVREEDSWGEEISKSRTEHWSNCEGKRLFGGKSTQRLTINPRQENTSKTSLNEWQVEIGGSEPEECRCEGVNPSARIIGSDKNKAAPYSDYSSFDALTGVENTVGGSESLTTPDWSSYTEGVETTIGSSSRMSEIVENPFSGGTNNDAYAAAVDAAIAMDMPPPSGRRRKSLKTIFRLGLFSTKTKKKDRSDEDLQSPDVGPPPQTSHRHVQRRVSRLDMNEPIEDIFSEVTFKTMQKRPSASTEATQDSDASDDEDIVEDPEAILQSIMNRQGNEDYDEESYTFQGVDQPVSNDDSEISDTVAMEKELLLPEENGAKSGQTREESVTSHNDLR